MKPEVNPYASLSTILQMFFADSFHSFKVDEE